MKAIAILTRRPDRAPHIGIFGDPAALPQPQRAEMRSIRRSPDGTALPYVGH